MILNSQWATSRWMFQLFLIKETVNIRKIFVDLNCEMIKSILVWTIKESLSLIRLKEKKENREEKKQVVIRKVFSRSCSLMLSVPQSSKWVAVSLDAAVRVDKQFLSLSSLFVVVVIVINVLQIILGGARAFFFSLSVHPFLFLLICRTRLVTDPLE